MSRKKFIPSLTPLRGIAATLVVFFHYHIFIAPLSSTESYVVSKLYLMVDLFFVLSGFVLHHVYGALFVQKIDRRSFWEFMKARFARIYPLHFFTFLYFFFWIAYMKARIDFEQTPAIFQNVFDDSAIPGILTLTHAWGTHMEATWNAVSWSVSVEWFLYIVFPFLVWIMGKDKYLVKVFLGLAALASLFILSHIIEPEWIKEITRQRQLTEEQLLYRPPNTIDIVTGFALLRGLSSFIFGMIAYEGYKNQLWASVLKFGYWFIVLWGGLLFLWHRDLLPDPFAIPVFSLLILHMAYVKGFLGSLLNSRVFTYLGDISYSVYMVHMPLILTLFVVLLLKGEVPVPSKEVNFVQNWVGAFIFWAIVIAIASATYRFIEQPARNKLRIL
jgi:peptidoglycan/LPS O-acetylase OafA/YrhL